MTVELRTGDRLSPHLTVVARLGSRAAHEVFLAHDDRRLTSVVVKMLRPDHDAAAVERLRAEAARLDAARHPAFPRLLEPVADRARPHFVMEHVEGPRLSRLVRRHGPLGLEQLVPLALDLAGALHYLHGERVVHLDIKPGNLVLAERVRVLDLGLARSLDVATRLTGRIGTASWMAPEQHSPAAGDLGPHTDVWGWGAVLFHAAAGDWPLRVTSRDGRRRVPARAEVGALEPPPWVPDALAAAIRDALAWRPADRPSPAALTRRLEPLLSGQYTGMVGSTWRA